MQNILQLSLFPQEYLNPMVLKSIVEKKSKIPSNILKFRVLKESLDCRRQPKYNLSILVSDQPLPSIEIEPLKDVTDKHRVIIVGSGPAGLFAAIRLMQNGVKPIILERGAMVEQRKLHVAQINRNQEINTESNICFGEGGAGTFSDGKLYTRSNKKGDIDEVLRIFVHFGADEKILCQTHSHIGTDKLSRILKNIRSSILAHGGEYHFNTHVTDFIVENGTIYGVRTADNKEFRADKVILATGHSARDIYQLFYDRGWEIQAQEFAMGVRVEHPQMLINQIQYHSKRPDNLLPPATYSLATNIDNRGVFSFCMCPGGVVVPSMNKDGIMVVNGMSNSMRSGRNANAAMVVSVKQADAKAYERFGALKLMKLQEEIERSMFIHRQIAPAQRMVDFLNNKASSTLPKTTYMPGVESCNLNQMLPQFVSKNLRQALQVFDNKMHGYITNEALLLGLESRTSSPVRIPRNQDLQHPQIKNLYPCGEGAGYAGGITSSAMDGLNTGSRVLHQVRVGSGTLDQYWLPQSNNI